MSQGFEFKKNSTKKIFPSRQAQNRTANPNPANKEIVYITSDNKLDPGNEWETNGPRGKADKIPLPWGKADSPPPYIENQYETGSADDEAIFDVYSDPVSDYSKDQESDDDKDIFPLRTQVQYKDVTRNSENHARQKQEIRKSKGGKPMEKAQLRKQQEDHRRNQEEIQKKEEEKTLEMIRLQQKKAKTKQKQKEMSIRLSGRLADERQLREQQKDRRRKEKEEEKKDEEKYAEMRRVHNATVNVRQRQKEIGAIFRKNTQNEENPWHKEKQKKIQVMTEEEKNMETRRLQQQKTNKIQRQKEMGAKLHRRITEQPPLCEQKKDRIRKLES
jgi:hypothetical protein